MLPGNSGLRTLCLDMRSEHLNVAARHKEAPIHVARKCRAAVRHSLACGDPSYEANVWPKLLHEHA